MNAAWGQETCPQHAFLACYSIMVIRAFTAFSPRWCDAVYVQGHNFNSSIIFCGRRTWPFAFPTQFSRWLQLSTSLVSTTLRTRVMVNRRGWLFSLKAMSIMSCVSRSPYHFNMWTQLIVQQWRRNSWRAGSILISRNLLSTQSSRFFRQKRVLNPFINTG